MSNKHSITFVPVGSMWQTIVKTDATVQLYKEDRTHPTILGTYLTAMIFCSHLLGISSTDIPNSFNLLEDVIVTIKEERYQLFCNILKMNYEN